MTPRLIPVLAQCIDRGIELGWNRAHKHDDAPAAEHIQRCMNDAIWNEIYEWFEFELPSEQPQE